jgi:aspartyl-tRNA(Asn)/glutamyl-tRNA(Gln) amidotransferase subunit C
VRQNPPLRNFAIILLLAPKPQRRPCPASIRTIHLLGACCFATLFGMGTSEFDVKYVARLARLSLTPEEEKKLGVQLHNILGYIEKLKQLDVSNVEPTAHAVPMVNVTRSDEVLPSLSNDEALRNAPAKAGGLFIVPKIVE